MLSVDELREACSICLGYRGVLYERYMEVLERWLSGGESGVDLLGRYIQVVSSLIFSAEGVVFDFSGSGGRVLSEEEGRLIEGLRRRVVDDFWEEGLDEVFYRCAKDGELFGLIGLMVVPVVEGGRVLGMRKYLMYPWDVMFLYPELDVDDSSQVIVRVVRMGRREAVRRFGEEVVGRAREVGGGLDFLGRVERVNVGEGGVEVGVDRRRELFRRYLIGQGGKDVVEVYEVWYKDEDGRVCVGVLVGDEVVEHRVNPFLDDDYPFGFYVSEPIVGTVYGRGAGDRALVLQERVDYWMEAMEGAVQLFARPPLLLQAYQGILDREEVVRELERPGGVVLIDSPDMRVEHYLPKVDLQAILGILEKYERNLLETVGLSDLVLGANVKGVRSASHAQLIAMFAGSHLKAKALRFEQFIERVMTLWARMLTQFDERYYDVRFPFKVEVYAHTSSPIMALNYQELLLNLFEIGAIGADVLIEMLPIPFRWKVRR